MNNQNRTTHYTSFTSLKRAMDINPNRLGDNGVDHILLSPYQSDDCGLGQTLSLEWCAPFTYPGLGKFGSVKNLWYWLTTEDHPDLTRTAPPKVVLKELLNKGHRKGKAVINFKAMIVYAKYLQLTKMRLVDIPEALLDKPWLIYKRQESGLRIMQEYSGWYSNAMKQIYAMMAAQLKGEKIDEEARIHQILIECRCLDNQKSKLPYTDQLLLSMGVKPVERPEKEQQPQLSKKQKYKRRQEEQEAAAAAATDATAEVAEPNGTQQPAALLTAQDANNDHAQELGVADGQSVDTLGGEIAVAEEQHTQPASAPTYSVDTLPAHTPVFDQDCQTDTTN